MANMQHLDLSGQAGDAHKDDALCLSVHCVHELGRTHAWRQHTVRQVRANPSMEASSLSRTHGEQRHGESTVIGSRSRILLLQNCEQSPMAQIHTHQ